MWNLCAGTKKLKKKQNEKITPREVVAAELLQEGIFFLIHLFARHDLVMKKLEIQKTNPTFIISVLKVKY